LITSRQRFHLPDLQARNLEALSPDEARELLIKIAPRLADVTPHLPVGAGVARDAVPTPSGPPARKDAPRNDRTALAVDAIAKLCGYLPQALRAAASLLAANEDLDPNDYLQQLSDERTRLEKIGVDPSLGIDIEASLNLSYACLSDEARQVFASLAVFPTSFDALAEETVCKDHDHTHLSELLRLSLVQYDPTTHRYQLLDLIRLLADRRLSAEARYTAQLQHGEHYKNVLSNANQLYLQGGEDISRGLALFDLEWIHIQTAQAWAQQNADSNEKALGLCDDIVADGYMLLDLRQHPRDRIKWLEIGLNAAQKLDRKQSQGWHLGNLGSTYYSLGETRQAIEFYNQRLEIVREIGDRRGEGNALGNLGVAYAAIGETRQAIEFYEQQLKIVREISDRSGEGNALGNLGSAYYALGETRQAIEFYEQHRDIAGEIGDRRGAGNALGNLGIAYYSLGEMRQAIEFYKQQLKIVHETGDRRGQGNALWNMSLALDQLGERDRAIELAEAALEIYEQIEDPHAEMVHRTLAKWRGKRQ
jgi:tetratricopeptide (TPR) repeat protein